MISSAANPFIESFKNEWLSWDGTQRTHDDTLDAVYYALRVARGDLSYTRPEYSDTPFIERKPRRDLVKGFAKAGS